MIYRLSLLLEKECGFKVGQVAFIKPHVLLIRTERGERVLKGYTSLQKATTQVIFMQSLRQAGFCSVPFVETSTRNSGILYWENMYWMLQKYIEPSGPFHFISSQNRFDGAALLERYHKYSKQLLGNPYLNYNLPCYPLYRKSLYRYYHFLSYLPLLQQNIREDILQFIVQTSLHSLRSLEKFYFLFKTEACTIIHGDVASHNFLQAEDGLYLIDYDQIAIAPQSIDYLQYASRILPSIKWSFARLRELPQIREQLSKKWFLSALLFPADILREWHAFFRKCSFDSSILSKTIEYTISHFEERKRFVKQIYSMLR